MLLNELGADPNFKDNDGYTPLMIAAYEGHFSVVETLLAAGVDVNITADDDEATALHTAAQRGFDGIVDALLKQEADKNALDKLGGTPLMGAAFNGRLPVVKTLLTARAGVNITDPNGRSALHQATMEGH